MRGYRRQAGHSNGQNGNGQNGNRQNSNGQNSNRQNSGPGRAVIPPGAAGHSGRRLNRRRAAPSATTGRTERYPGCSLPLSAAAGRARPHSARRMPPSRVAGPRGFTMIEMLIAMVIVAVLAAVILPAYRKQVIKSNRAEGTGALLRIMDRQERYYANNFPPTYASSMRGLGFRDPPIQTENGHYKIEVGNCTGSSDFKSCVKLTATAQGGQAGDGNLTLNSRGEKTRCGKDGWQHNEDCP